jgi:hypothetical protein
MYSTSRRISLTTRTALFEAWERWCNAEGETAGVQKDFTRIMKERSGVKGFSEGRVGNDRGWHGIGLPGGPEDRGVVTFDSDFKVTTPPSEFVENGSKSQSVRSQNTCKNGGVVDSSVHFDVQNENFLSEPPTQEKFSENGSEVYAVYGSVRSGLNFEIDGVEWEYLPDEESE